MPGDRSGEGRDLRRSSRGPLAVPPAGGHPYVRSAGGSRHKPRRVTMLATPDANMFSASAATEVDTDHPLAHVRRRTIDKVLVALGAVAAVVLATGGALLTWGNNFAEDYVRDELS